MNLYAKLLERESRGKPLRVGLIGAGKFAAMYLAQVPRTPGIHLVGIADLSPANAKANLERVGWKPAVFAAPTLAAALKQHTTHLGDDWRALVSHPEIDIIIEATGNPLAAVEHALAAFEHGKHVVMVTVEASVCPCFASSETDIVTRAASARIAGSLNVFLLNERGSRGSRWCASATQNGSEYCAIIRSVGPGMLLMVAIFGLPAMWMAATSELA